MPAVGEVAGVHTDRRLVAGLGLPAHVSKRDSRRRLVAVDVLGGGCRCYALDGKAIGRADDLAAHPDPELLAWHALEVDLAL